MRWLNEPPQWRQSGDVITAVTTKETDFWRETHYGFVRDDGHFYHSEASGDFTAMVRVSGEYRHLYDQAGLMLRQDERTWIKAGIEYADGRQNLSVVVTRDFSDWSVLPLSVPPDEVWLRLSRHGTAVRVEHSHDGTRFDMLRLAYLPPHDPVAVGVMCCSPQREGFVATFRDFRLGPPISPELHAG